MHSSLKRIALQTLVLTQVIFESCRQQAQSLSRSRVCGWPCGVRLFCPGNCDGNIEPFFWILEGLIAGSFGHVNVWYTIINRINNIKLKIQLTLPIDPPWSFALYDSSDWNHPLLFWGHTIDGDSHHLMTHPHSTVSFCWLVLVGTTLTEIFLRMQCFVQKYNLMFFFHQKSWRWAPESGVVDGYCAFLLCLLVGKNDDSATKITNIGVIWEPKRFEPKLTKSLPLSKSILLVWFSWIPSWTRSKSRPLTKSRFGPVIDFLTICSQYL